jgi:hypothetical protein
VHGVQELEKRINSSVGKYRRPQRLEKKSTDEERRKKQGTRDGQQRRLRAGELDGWTAE